jgi:hypothetical protein
MLRGPGIAGFHRARHLADFQRELLLLGFAGVVGADDALYQRVPNHVAVFEVAEANAFHSFEHVDGVKQARLARVRQVDLRDVAGDDRLGVVAQASEKHLHLLDGGVAPRP